MNGQEWGFLYNEHKDKILDPRKIEDEISQLMQDDEVTNKRGIYQYVLSRNEKHLSLRAFDEKIKRAVYEKQKGICPQCIPQNNHHELKDMQGDHITPWSKGAKTTIENCQMLCNDCNSCLVSFRLVGQIDGFIANWASVWVTSWLFAFPVVLIVAPMARRIVD